MIIKRYKISIINRLSKYNRILYIARGKGVKSIENKSAKNFVSRCIDLLRWYRIHHNVQENYYKYGFETKSHSEQDEFLSDREGHRYRNIINSMLAQALNNMDYQVVDWDKFIANNYLNYLGIPCAVNKALIKRGQVILPGGVVDDLESLLDRSLGTVFIKSLTGVQGRGIFKVDFRNQRFFSSEGSFPLDQLSAKLKKGFWVVQDEIKQHSDWNKINPNAVNCLRISTILDDYTPTLFESYAKFASGVALTDNWNSLSMVVDINKTTGTLEADAFLYSDKLTHTVFQQHPDTGVKFKDTPVPFYFEAVDICLRAHQYLYGSVIIGWDVALTSDGPIIVEANSNPGLYRQRYRVEGLRPIMEKIYWDYKNKER